MQANPGELFWPGSSMPTWRDCMCSKSNFEAALNVGLRIHGWWLGNAEELPVIQNVKKNLWKYATDFSIVKKLCGYCGYRSAIKLHHCFKDNIFAVKASVAARFQFKHERPLHV